IESEIALGARDGGSPGDLRRGEESPTSDDEISGGAAGVVVANCPGEGRAVSEKSEDRLVFDEGVMRVVPRHDYICGQSRDDGADRISIGHRKSVPFDHAAAPANGEDVA